MEARHSSNSHGCLRLNVSWSFSQQKKPRSMFYSKKICQDIDGLIDDQKMDERLITKNKVRFAQGHRIKHIMQLTTG